MLSKQQHRASEVQAAPWGSARFRDCHGDYRTEVDLEALGQLCEQQATLPMLPVPEVKDTMRKLLRSVQPLCSASEFERFVRKVESFVNSQQAGELQQKLLARAKQRWETASKTSWLAEWWNTRGYLKVRDSVVINVSYFYQFCDHPNRQLSQVSRAALLVEGAVCFRESIMQGTLSPDRLGKQGPWLCSVGYKYMFNSCRIPHTDSDFVRLYDPSFHNHIVVVRKGLFFRLDLVVCDVCDGKERRRYMTAQEIGECLNDIVRYVDANDQSTLAGVGVLSSNSRPRWAAMRAEVLASKGGASLREIESAILLLCLDTSNPITDVQTGRELWHSDGFNRFYDKAIQLVVFQNGKAGMLAEHSMMDGMLTLRFADFVLKHELKPEPSLHDSKLQQPKPACAVKVPSPWRLLPFWRTAPLEIAIGESAARLAVRAIEHEMECLRFKGYGSSSIKKWGYSPDAFVQMAIQLAFYRGTQTFAATYEATQTRRFLHGRTETTRSLTPEAKGWVLAMEAAGRENGPSRTALKAATDAHIKTIAAASQGQGIDRHLFGLRALLSEAEETPALFSDEILSRSSTWLLSTSQLSHPRIAGWGYGEVAPRGFGLSYSIKDQELVFVVTCRKGGPALTAQELAHLLRESLAEMQRLADVPTSKL